MKIKDAQVALTRRGFNKFLSATSYAANFLILLLVLAMPAAGQGQEYSYVVVGNEIKILEYRGLGGDVTIPSTIEGLPVRIIASYAFEYCTNLTSITVPDSVREIGSAAFSACDKLTRAQIGSGVISIAPSQYSAFEWCSSLTEITVDAQNTAYSSVDGILFNKDQSTLVDFPEGRAGSYTIPNTVRLIKDSAFTYSTRLTSLTVGNQVTSIGNFTFENCTNLRAVYFQGNAPTCYMPFSYESTATVYYLSGTTGWWPYYGGRPTMLWQPTEYTYTITNNKITTTGYTGAGGAVTVPSIIDGFPVTSIGNRTFKDCANLTSVTIGNNITNIGEYAFQSCSNLRGVTIGSGVTSIGEHAFESCSNLRGITNGSGVTHIGAYAFMSCTTLTNAMVGSSVISIGDYAFMSCSSLTNAVIGKNVTEIGRCAYFQCTNLTGITVDSLNPWYSSVNGVLFNRAKNTVVLYPAGKNGNYTIPNNVTSIGGYAFSGCEKLTLLTVPSTLRSIGDSGFSDCSALTGLYFHGNAPSVGYNVFSNTTSAVVYYISGTTGWEGTLGGRPTVMRSQDYAYTFNGIAMTITGYTGPGGAVIIPSMLDGLPVTSIGASAFDGSIAVTSITIPDSITNIAANAFYNCGALTAITVDAQNPSYSSLDGLLFNKSKTALIQYPGGKIGTMYTIPKSVTSVDGYAFGNCTNLITITIPNSVSSIGDFAFADCIKLTGAYFQGNAPSFGSSVFSGATNAIVYYQFMSLGWWGAPLGGQPRREWEEYTMFVGNRIMKYNGPGGAVIIPDTINGQPIVSIMSSAFNGCSQLTSIVIPSSVTDIWDGSFNGCTNLISIEVDVLNPAYVSVDGVLFNKSRTELIQFPGGKAGSFTISSSVTNLSGLAYCPKLVAIEVDAENAFYSSVEGVLFDKPQTTLVQYPAGKVGSYTIPDTVAKIGHGAFGGSINLTGVTISTNVSSIEWWAFNGAGLTNVTIPPSVSNIDEFTFYWCPSLTRVTLPNSVTNIARSAFAYSGLTSVTIPASVASIASFAFGGCSNLTQVYFQGNAPSIGAGDVGYNSMFYNSTNVTAYYLPGTMGWGPSFAERPTVLWNPQAQTGDESFGVKGDGFGFTIRGTSNLVVVVEACTDLANGTWVPVRTNTLVDGVAYFGDAGWTNCARRFYRIRSP